MKYFLIFLLFFKPVSTFSFFHQNSEPSNNIWVPFIAKGVLVQNDFKRCTINVYLKNEKSHGNIYLLKYLNQGMVR